MAVVVQRDLASYQKQYGSLWAACEAYLTRTMLPEQAVTFETVIDPAFVAAVAQTRLLEDLVAWVKQA